MIRSLSPSITFNHVFLFVASRGRYTIDLLIRLSCFFFLSFSEIHACSFDLRAPNAITYFVMSTLSYVVTPYIIMAFSCISIMFNSGVCDDRHHAHSPTFPAPSWNVVQQKDVVLPLTLTMVTSFSLQLPKYVSEIERALDPQLRMPSRFLFTATWLQTFAVNCCFACLLLLCHAFRACMGSEALYFIPWDSRAASDKDG